MLETLQNEPHPIFKAIEERNLKEVNEIINKDPSVLEQQDSKRINPIVYAISLWDIDIVEAIIKKEPLVLEQRDLAGKTPIFYAIALEKLGFVEEILYQKPSVIEQKDLAGNTPVDLATALSIISLGNNKNDRASRVLQKVLEYKFPGNINNDSREDFKELFLKEMLLKGIYSAQTVSFSFKVLEKAFDKVTPENTFKEIYQKLFEKVDKNQPITSKNNEEMFIFQSKLKGHESFFIFHVNEDNKLTSISYCDGNEIDEGRKIEGSKTHINGVTTFSLETPIEYNNDFAKNFINENTQDKSLGVFYDKLIKKKLYFKGSHIEFSEITHSIPTKIQIRSNCAFKSPSLAVRFISHQQNPQTMVYGFDEKTKKPTGAGYDEYKKFKGGLTKNALDFIIKIKEKISSKSDPFSEYLKKEIEDVMKITGFHNKRKLRPIPEEKSNQFKSVKRKKLATGSHEAISAILSKESPSESLSLLPNQPSPLVTKNTRQK